MPTISRRSFVCASLASVAACSKTEGTPQIRHTSAGRYAILGHGTKRPAVFTFSSDAVSALIHPQLGIMARLLTRRGFVAVSVDLPCHGDDVRHGEPGRLEGWRYRIDHGEPLMDSFIKRCKLACSDLIEDGTIRSVVSFGISRGGYAAMAFAASDARIKRVAAASPVTDLMALREFNGCTSKLPSEPHPQCPSWISINSGDTRVGSSSAVSLAKSIRAELHIMPASGHASPRKSYDMAADWLANT